MHTHVSTSDGIIHCSHAVFVSQCVALPYSDQLACPESGLEQFRLTDLAKCAIFLQGLLHYNAIQMWMKIIAGIMQYVPTGSGLLGVKYVGFHIPKLLDLCMDLLDRQRRKEELPGVVSFPACLDDELQRLGTEACALQRFPVIAR